MSSGHRQSRFERGEDVVVMKFGGTSVEDTAAVKRLIGIVQSRIGAHVVVVVSALAKVTDQLLEAGKAAASGHLGAALAKVRDIYVRHEEMADSLLSSSAYGSLDREIRCEFEALEVLLQDLDSSRELDLRTQDRLLGFGECFSSKLVSVGLREVGLQAAHVDARSCIITDGRHGQASPLWDVTNENLLAVLSPLLEAEQIPVLGGFIASSSDGVPTTLGRGGSDFSAAIVGAAIGASRVEIWTDVDGVMTTDPKVCADARVIRRLSFDEAADLAHFGAKVLHPATVAPAMRANIPVHVLNSRRPEAHGTEILSRPNMGNRVSAITAKRNVATLEIHGRRGVDALLLNKVFAVLDQHSCSVDVMGTSLDRISLLVGANGALPKIVSELQQVADVRSENHKALVCLVGENIRRQPEVASRVFGVVSDMDVRVLCQGASDRTISFLVEESKAEESVRRLHAAFFPKVEPSRDWGGISAAFCQAG
ncbi:MAG TPA: aspartate kinase [Dongiaceae bacterium]|nr:aspartate kinase [Dongiaceae bacterium]